MTEKLTAAELQELMRAENQKTIQECSAEIAEILEKHDCILISVVQIRGQSMTSYVEIVKRG